MVAGDLAFKEMKISCIYRVLPWSILPGSRMMPFSNTKMPSTATPSNLNGSVSIQKIGYNTKANIAIGQQKIKRMIQAMNAIIG